MAPLPEHPTPALSDGRIPYRRHSELIVLIAVASLAISCGITWGLPNSADWAIDSIAPVGPLRYAREMLTAHHWWSKYPPFHFTMLAILDAPYLALLGMRGAFRAGDTAYPYGFTHPEAALGSLTLIARMLSAAMGLGTTIVVYLLAREFHGRRAGLIAGLLFVASPLTLYYANSANLDVPYLFWSSLALVALVRIARGGATTWAFGAAGAFAALAVATKDQAYGLFALMPLAFLARPLSETGRCVGRRQQWLFAVAVAVTTYIVAANVLVDWQGWLAHVRYITHEGSAPYQMFPATLRGYVELGSRCARLTADAVTWPVVLLTIAGCVVVTKRRVRGASVLLYSTASYLATFIAPILYVFPRYVLPAVLTAAVLAGVGGAWMWERGGRVGRSAVTACVVWAAVYGAGMDAGLLLDSRYDAEAWMRINLPAGAIVGTNGDATYLPRLPSGMRTVPIEIDASGPVPSDRSPDYLILSDAYYRRYLRHPETRPVVERLLAGDFQYEPVVSFYRRWLPATDLIPTVNPRIAILRRRAGDDVGAK